MAFSPDGRLLAIGGADGSVSLYDPAARTPIRRLEMGSPSAVGALAFAPDGSRLAAISLKHGLVTWSPTGSAPTVLRHDDPTAVGWDFAHSVHVGFSRDGSTLVDGTYYGITVWDAATATKRVTLAAPGDPGLTGLAIAPAGDLIAQADNHENLLLWDPHRPEEPIAALPGLVGASAVLTFTADGRTLVTSGVSGRIAFWDVVTRVPRVTLTGGDSIEAMAPAPDGRRLYVQRYGSLVAFELDPLRWRERLCRLVGRPLTTQEWERYVVGREWQPVC